MALWVFLWQGYPHQQRMALWVMAHQKAVHQQAVHRNRALALAEALALPLD